MHDLLLRLHLVYKINLVQTLLLLLSLLTRNSPFSLDCATSIIQRGQVELYDRQGEDTPAGTVIGEDGSAMTDSPAIYKLY